MERINLVELCAGYGSQALAFKQLGLSYDIVAWSEFDPESKKPLDEQPAVIAHNLLHPEAKGRNLGDMTKIDWEKWKTENKGIEIDLLTYSTPCQSISNAGLQHGMKEGSGTRSSILWFTENAIRHLRPKYLLQENVKNIVSKKFRSDFLKWCSRVEQLGYKNFMKVLNAKDFGVPQSREREFMLSIRNDIGRKIFVFPPPMKLHKELIDVVNPGVDDEFFIQSKKVAHFLKTNENEGDDFIYVTTKNFLDKEEVQRLISDSLNK